MADTDRRDTSDAVLWTGITVFCCVLIHFIYKIFFGPEQKETVKPEKDADSQVPESTEALLAAESRPSGKSKKRTTWKGKTEFSHPWLLKSLKGHAGTVLHVDFSSNGKFLASTCEDGSVQIWDIRDLQQKEHRNMRINIDFDYGNFVAWSPDSKAIVVHLVRENRIQVYRLEKKKDGMIGSATPVITFDKVHEDDVVGFDIACNGKFIMSCSNRTDMVVWDLRGQQLARLDTYLMSTYSAKISPCGRFVVATGFSPDVKVMEVSFNKSGEFKQIGKAFELSGHTSGIYDVAFDVDTSHIATISKDGSWKLYHTKIEYARGETPHTLKTGTYTQSAHPPRIALSPDAAVLAVTADNAVQLYDTHTGQLYNTIDNIFSGLITCVRFDSTGKYLFVSGDRAVRILHNICGYFTTANSCRLMLSSKQTSATADRLRATVRECEEMLAKFPN